MSRLYSGTYLCRERSVVLFKALDGSSSHIRTGQRWRHRNRLHSTLTDAASTRSNKIVDTFQSEPAEPTLPPLAALPFSVLLRSLLVSTISSSPYLLQPSLLALSFLSKPHRGFLFDVKRNPLLYWPLKWTFYRQFCAGENVAECQKTMNSMRSMGFEGTLLTYAKETVFDHKDGTEQAFGTKESSTSDVNETCEAIKAWKDGTLETVNMLGEGDQLAVKLTGAGPAATKAFAAGNLPPRQMLDALDEICRASRDRRARIVVDAESQHFQPGIAKTAVYLMQKYNTDGYALIFHSYQAYLKGTPQRLARDIERAANEGWTIGIKVVRGAYIASDQRSLIHDTKEDTDAAYDSIVQGIICKEYAGFGGNGGKAFPNANLLLATHNKKSALAALRLHQQRTEMGLPVVPVKFAQLHGMSDEVSFSLLRAGTSRGETPKVLKCSTWGGLDECLAYMLRRAIENRDAVSRTHEEYQALKKELRRRLW